METEQLKRKFYSTGTFLLTLLSVVGIIWIISLIKYAFILLGAAVLLAYLLAPLVKFFNSPIHLQLYLAWFKVTPQTRKLTLLNTKKGLPRLWAIVVVYILLAAVFFVILSYVIPAIAFEFRKLVGNIPGLVETLHQKCSVVSNWVSVRVPPFLEEYYQQMLLKLEKEAQNFSFALLNLTFPVAKRVLGGLTGILLLPLITFYILMDSERYKTGFLALVPPKRREEVTELMIRIDQALGRFIRGQIVVCAIIGFSVTIVLLLFGIEYPYLIGAFAGIIDFIPYVGVVAGLIPAVLLALLKSPFTALLLLVVLLAVHWAEGHIIVPSVMGQAVKLPSLIILISLIIGFELMGILGALFAVPIASITRVLLEYYEEKLNQET